ncbi:MAG TPA: HNH endonuclease [Rhizomicrobium sp.]
MTRHLAGIDIARVRRSSGRAGTGASLEGVDIAFIARKPGVGQVVVGAYLNATVHEKTYRQRRNPLPDRKHKTLAYLCEAKASDAFLVPPLQRDFPIPYAPKDGMGFPGHANVWYGDDARASVAAFARRLQEYLRRKSRELQSMGKPDSVREVILEDQERDEIERITNDKRMRETMRWALIRARIGQGLFRKRLELIEQGCRVTGIRERDLLRASHIKPWSRSSDREKLDGENGLLLTPHIDHLFDKGFITFSDHGQIVVSERLPRFIIHDWRLQGVGVGNPFTPRQMEFLRYHREQIFK